MNNTAWENARQRTNLTQVRVHDLKHKFGRSLRAAGVSYEDRQDLLGHKSNWVRQREWLAEHLSKMHQVFAQQDRDL